MGSNIESVGGKLWYSAIVSLGDHLGADGKPDAGRILEIATERLEQGAQLLDIEPYPAGFRGQRPSADEELRRLVPVLRKLVAHIAVPVIVTTSNAGTAERAAALGADAIRDPSGLRNDAALVRAIKPTSAALILGDLAPMRPLAPGEAGTDVITTTLRDLSAALGRASVAEIDSRRVTLEPNFSTIRRTEENAELLRHLSALHKLKRPVAVSFDGARFAVDSIKVEGAERAAADAACVAIAALHGVHIVRTADVAAARRAAYVAELLLDRPEEEASREPKPAERR